MAHPLLEFAFNVLVNSIFAFILFVFLTGCFLGSSIGVNQFKDSNMLVKILMFIIYGIFNWITVLWYFLITCKIFGKPLVLECAFPF